MESGLQHFQRESVLLENSGVETGRNRHWLGIITVNEGD